MADQEVQDRRQADIRRLLRTFGVKADEAIQQYLEAHPHGSPLRLRISLETAPGAAEPGDELHFSVEGEISR